MAKLNLEKSEYVISYFLENGNREKLHIYSLTQTIEFLNKAKENNHIIYKIENPISRISIKNIYEKAGIKEIPDIPVTLDLYLETHKEIKVLHNEGTSTMVVDSKSATDVENDSFGDDCMYSYYLQDINNKAYYAGDVYGDMLLSTINNELVLDLRNNSAMYYNGDEDYSDYGCDDWNE